VPNSISSDLRQKLMSCPRQIKRKNADVTDHLKTQFSER
jgi:hypothetical protein